ncbi:MAG: tautomerase family protein [Hyphomonas sp.]|nr:tautomerase family protein [Hyphomonas sp.]
MPLYLCNAAKGAISDEAKPKIAADITRIHCDVTGAPPQFVHAFFVEEDTAPPLDGKSAVLFGSIRANRTDAQKAQIIAEMRQSISTHTGIALDAVGMMTTDVPASWAFEGGEVMPEPGEEAEWLARHNRPSAAE